MRGGRLDVTGRIERSEASEVRSVSHCVRLTTDTHRRPNLTAQGIFCCDCFYCHVARSRTREVGR